MQISERTLIVAKLLRILAPMRNVRGWDRFVRLVFNPDRQKGFNLSFPLYGHTYYGRADDFIDWSAFFYGAYEKHLLSYFLGFSHQKYDAVMLDVGANHGHHSHIFASQGMRVHAFEPDPVLVSEMTRKAELSGLIDRIAIHPLGLGDAEGVLPFYAATGPETTESGNRGIGTFVSSPTVKMRGAQPLQIRNGDSYLEELGIEKVHMIKIDTEGFERQVLDGLLGVVRRDCPVLWVEISNGHDETGLNIRYLKSVLPNDYRYYAMRYSGRIIRTPRLIEITEENFKTPDNLFLVSAR